MATYTKLPSGRYRVQVRRKGIYKAATFSRKADARQWAEKVEAGISFDTGDTLLNPKQLRVGKLIDLYLEEKHFSSKNAPYVMGRLKKRFGHLLLSRFSPAHIRQYAQQRINHGVSGPSIAHELAYLSGLLQWLRYAKRLDVNPRVVPAVRKELHYRGVTLTSTERDRLPTDAELECIYARFRASKTLSLPMETIVKFALASAMRLGEIVSIQAEDVNVRDRSVIIRSRKHPTKKQGNDQCVPLPPAAWAIISELLQEGCSGLLFPYRADSISERFRAARKACGIKDLRFHDLRHAATVSLFRDGLDIPRVALITGHKSWSQLKRYTNLKPKDVHHTLDKGIDDEKS